MFNIKQITAAMVIATTFLYSTISTAATKECAKDQYLVGTTCTKCPANATCNGKKATCKTGYQGEISSGKTTCHCLDGEYFLKDKKTCKKHPANGTANGKTAKCNTSFQTETSANGTVTCSCKASQYIANGVCKNKPANGTADGKTAKCNKTFEKSVDGATGEVTCSCKAGYIIKDGKCVQPCTANQYRLADKTCYNCPANATCNGEKAVCNKDYITRTASNGSGKISCGCEKGEYVVGNTCKACPKANVENCNGGVNPKCKETFNLVKNPDGTKKCVCKDNEYIAKGKCVACPTYGNCNGTSVISCEGGRKRITDSKDKVVCGCGEGQYHNGTACTSCPKECTAKK